MTVTEYREKHPDCKYCKHRGYSNYICIATGKKISNRTAKKCPCYAAVKWHGDEDGGKRESTKP